MLVVFVWRKKNLADGIALKGGGTRAVMPSVSSVQVLFQRNLSPPQT